MVRDHTEQPNTPYAPHVLFGGRRRIRVRSDEEEEKFSSQMRRRSLLEAAAAAVFLELGAVRACIAEYGARRSVRSHPSAMFRHPG